CSKGTKRGIDIWRLRDISNENADAMPISLIDWEQMFAAIYPSSHKEKISYLSRKLVEEVGEVSAELTKPQKRATLLRKMGVDSYGFEIADLFAWICQASNALREDSTPPKTSILGEAL